MTFCDVNLQLLKTFELTILQHWEASSSENLKKGGGGADFVALPCCYQVTQGITLRDWKPRVFNGGAATTVRRLGPHTRPNPLRAQPPGRARPGRLIAPEAGTGASRRPVPGQGHTVAKAVEAGASPGAAPQPHLRPDPAPSPRRRLPQDGRRQPTARPRLRRHWLARRSRSPRALRWLASAVRAGSADERAAEPSPWGAPRWRRRSSGRNGGCGALPAAPRPAGARLRGGGEREARSALTLAPRRGRACARAGRGGVGSEFPPRPGTGRCHFVPLGLWGGRAGAGVAQENAAGYWRCLESAFLMSEGGRIKSFLLLFEAVREDACCVHCTGRASSQSSLQVARAGWQTISRLWGSTNRMAVLFLQILASLLWWSLTDERLKA